MKTNDPKTLAGNNSILVNVTRIVDETTTLKIDHNIGKDKTKATTISQETHLNLHNSTKAGHNIRNTTNSIISSTNKLANSTMHNKTRNSSITNKDPNNIMVVDNTTSSKTSTRSINSITNQCLNPTSSINSIQLVDCSHRR